MQSSVFDVSIALFRGTLKGMQILLEKAEEHVRSSHQSPDSLLSARLQADMLPLAFQIGQSVNSSAGAFRRIRKEPFDGHYVFNDYAAARACVDEALAYCHSIDPAEFAGQEDEEITWRGPKVELRYKASDYLTTHAIPNFYFHSVMTYSILRSLGIPVGKLNYLGRRTTSDRNAPRGAALAALMAMEAQDGSKASET